MYEISNWSQITCVTVWEKILLNTECEIINQEIYFCEEEQSCKRMCLSRKICSDLQGRKLCWNICTAWFSVTKTEQFVFIFPTLTRMGLWIRCKPSESVEMKRTQMSIGPFVSVVMFHLLLALQRTTIDRFSSAVPSYWSLLNYDECLRSYKVKSGQMGPGCLHLSHFCCVCNLCRVR